MWHTGYHFLVVVAKYVCASHTKWKTKQLGCSLLTLSAKKPDERAWRDVYLMDVLDDWKFILLGFVWFVVALVPEVFSSLFKTEAQKWSSKWYCISFNIFLSAAKFYCTHSSCPVLLWPWHFPSPKNIVMTNDNAWDALVHTKLRLIQDWKSLCPPSCRYNSSKSICKALFCYLRSLNSRHNFLSNSIQSSAIFHRKKARKSMISCYHFQELHNYVF